MEKMQLCVGLMEVKLFVAHSLTPIATSNINPFAAESDGPCKCACGDAEVKALQSEQQDSSDSKSGNLMLLEHAHNDRIPLDRKSSLSLLVGSFELFVIHGKNCKDLTESYSHAANCIGCTRKLIRFPTHRLIQIDSDRNDPVSRYSSSGHLLFAFFMTVRAGENHSKTVWF